MKILILEDNRADADLTFRQIKKDFAESDVDIATTIKEARSLLKKTDNYDIGILDVQLPDGSGLDLLMEIRKAELPMAVIILTGSSEEEMAVAALKTGADDYIVKKIGYVSQLADVIHYALKNKNRSAARAVQPVRILYIEHYLPDIDLTRRHMKKFAPHFQIKSVSSAKEGLQLLSRDERQTCNYDILLLDYRLPDINSLDIIKVIKQERKLDIPIIIVTGQGNEEIAIQALKLGADEYLVKRENYLFRLPSMIHSAFQRRELEKQKAALQESETRYRLLADNSGDVIFVLDMNLNYTYISPAVKTLRGYEPEEALKQKLTDVLTPDSYKRAMDGISEALSDTGNNTGKDVEPRVLELEMIKKDGSTIWTEVKASLITDENKRPAGILGVTRDITTRKYATDQLRKLSQAVEQSPASTMITDAKGNIEYVNSKFTEVTGYSFEEIIGKNPRFLKSGHTTKEEYAELWNTITKGDEWSGEFLNKRKDGSLYWEQVSISSIKDDEGTITHFLAVKEDITEKKKHEVELIREKEKAEESDRLKTAFLHNISHEIRTPMNAITGFAGLIDDPDLTQEKRKHYTEVIRNSSNQLLSIITDIISIASIEAGQEKVVTKKVRLNHLMKTLYSQFAPKAKAKGIQIILETPLKDAESDIQADETKLVQILSNLTNNALKFTLKGRIIVKYAVNKAFLKFSISDTGIGIPAELHEKIFDRFLQADQTVTREYEGMGLGLSISKAYVELMGGDIWLTSKPDKGSVFYFTIPYIRESETKISEAVPEDEVTLHFDSEKTILVAEDEDMNFFLIEEYLANPYIKIIRAVNGIEAVECCERNKKIDLVLMDIKMPRMDGYDATRKIKGIRPELPVIALTAYAQSGDDRKALNAGCSAYIPKPVAQENLFIVIRKFLLK